VAPFEKVCKVEQIMTLAAGQSQQDQPVCGGLGAGHPGKLEWEWRNGMMKLVKWIIPENSHL